MTPPKPSIRKDGAITTSTGFTVARPVTAANAPAIFPHTIYARSEHGSVLAAPAMKAASAISQTSTEIRAFPFAVHKPCATFAVQGTQPVDLTRVQNGAFTLTRLPRTQFTTESVTAVARMTTRDLHRQGANGKRQTVLNSFTICRRMQ